MGWGARSSARRARWERGTADTSRDDDDDDDDDDAIRTHGENLNLGRVTDDDDSYRSIATRVQDGYVRGVRGGRVRGGDDREVSVAGGEAGHRPHRQSRGERGEGRGERGEARQ